MKIRNILFENKQYFITIAKIHSSDKLSVMDAYRINRLVKKLTELHEEYIDLKMKLLKQYGAPGKEEGSTTIEPKNREVFDPEYNDLLNIEHDLGIDSLPFPPNLQDGGISSADLSVMELFFDLSTLETTSVIDDELKSEDKN